MKPVRCITLPREAKRKSWYASRNRRHIPPIKLPARFESIPDAARNWVHLPQIGGIHARVRVSTLAFVLGVHAEPVFQLPCSRKRLPDYHRPANRVGAEAPDGLAAKLRRNCPNLQFRMAGSKLADQNLGPDHFVFAESVENTHAVRRPITLSFPDKMGNCGYFRYCVGCGPFSSVSRSQIQPSRGWLGGLVS